MTGVGSLVAAAAPEALVELDRSSPAGIQPNRQLLAHKIELRPDAAQIDYLNQCCGVRRHAYNKLLEHFRESGVKWSKATAYEYFVKTIRPQFPFYAEVTSRAARNAIDDLDNAFKHFFRRVKLGQKPGFPRFKRKDVNDGFALREAAKFDVEDRKLRLEKCPGLIDMRQKLRFDGKLKQVTVTKRAGKFFASILVETVYAFEASARLASIGVDFGVRALATISDGTVIPANQKLKANLRRLKRRNRNLSKKQRGSNRRAKAKLALARLHERIANQRRAACHEASDMITRKADAVAIENLNVKGMTPARAVRDAGFGMLRAMVEYKAKLRGVAVMIADRFYPSSKTCSACGCVKSGLKRDDSVFKCADCGHEQDRDLNAALNLNRLHTFAADVKRTQEERKTAPQGSAASLTA
jgi:putative transposase